MNDNIKEFNNYNHNHNDYHYHYHKGLDSYGDHLLPLPEKQNKHIKNAMREVIESEVHLPIQIFTNRFELSLLNIEKRLVLLNEKFASIKNGSISQTDGKKKQDISETNSDCLMEINNLNIKCEMNKCIMYNRTINNKHKE